MGRLQKNSQKLESKKSKETQKESKAKTDNDDDYEDEIEEDFKDQGEYQDDENDYESCDDEDENDGDELDGKDGKNKQGDSKKKITLYDLLDVSKDATLEQIKKGYKQLALKIHPDKNKDDPQAKEKFQKIVEAYNILSDPSKKKVYDETGSYGEDFNQHAFESAYNFYRTIYKKIEKEDILDFEKKYRGSAMEDEDLINFYNENNGDLTTILECIPLSRNEDVDRFIEKYEELFKKGSIKKTKEFNKSKKQIITLDEDEEDGFQEQQNGLKDLAQQILAKKGDAMSFLDQLASKYGGQSNKKTKKSDNSDKKAGKTKQKK